MRYSWSKNNKEQRDKPKGLPCVTGCKGSVKKGADGKWVAPSVLCPVHIGRHAKLLQSLDAGVSVEELKAPVFSKVARNGKVPSGATLVVDENERDAAATGGPACAGDHTQEGFVCAVRGGASEADYGHLRG